MSALQNNWKRFFEQYFRYMFQFRETIETGETVYVLCCFVFRDTKKYEIVNPSGPAG